MNCFNNNNLALEYMHLSLTWTSRENILITESSIGFDADLKEKKSLSLSSSNQMKWSEQEQVEKSDELFKREGRA